MNSHTTTEQEHASMVSRLMKNSDDLQASSTPFKWALIHAVFGIAGELAELDDYSDKDNLLEESGDILFYCRNLRQVLSLPDYVEGSIKSASAFSVAGDLLDVAKRITIYSYELTDARLQTFAEIVDGAESIVEHALASYGITREQALRANLEKLMTGANARYKSGYSDAAAQARADKQTNVKGHASPEHASKTDQTASSASHGPPCSDSSSFTGEACCNHEQALDVQPALCGSPQGISPSLGAHPATPHLVLYSYKGKSNLVFTLVAEDLAEAEAMLNAIKATAALDRGHYGENPDSYGFILPNVKAHTQKERVRRSENTENK